MDYYPFRIDDTLNFINRRKIMLLAGFVEFWLPLIVGIIIGAIIGVLAIHIFSTKGIKNAQKQATQILNDAQIKADQTLKNAENML